MLVYVQLSVFADGGSIIGFTTCNVLVGIECVEMEIDKVYKESFF